MAMKTVEQFRVILFNPHHSVVRHHRGDVIDVVIINFNRHRTVSQRHRPNKYSDHQMNQLCCLTLELVKLTRYSVASIPAMNATCAAVNEMTRFMRI